jgi:hypothetical protein
MKDIKKIQEFFSKALKEIDVNDPVLMKARAAAFQRTQPKPELPKPTKTINPEWQAIKNADKIRALKKQRVQLMIDMEQEAEPEGGPIADRYGRELNKIDKAIAILSGQGKGSSEKDTNLSYDEVIKRAAMIGEARTAIDMAKKQLDALGVKYEMSKTDKVRPFKVIYKPINKSDKWYDEFDDIVDLFNLRGFVKSSMNEAKSLTGGYPHKKTSGNSFEKIEITEPMDDATKSRMIKNFRAEGWDAKPNSGGGITAVKKTMMEAKFMSGMLSGKNFINAKLKNYPKAVAKVNQLIDMIGESNFTIEMAEWVWDFFNNASFESPVYEASKKEETEFHKKLDKLVHSTFGKRKGEMEEAVNLKASKLSSAEYQKAKKLKDFKASDWKWNADEDLYTKVNEEELTEANVPSNIAEFAKRKGVSSLVRKVAGWAEKVGKRIAGGTAVGKNYSTLVLDLDYQQNGEIRINTDDETVTLFDEPVNSFNEFQRVYSDGQGFNLEEALVKKVISKIREAKSTPCWKGYEQKGMKEKNGKQVPNCVPKK